MQRTLKYALVAVLGAALVVPAMAQSDNFPDVPDNHWAYEALATMKKNGLLVGYPDGLFRGSRPASRYELAVAVHATYVNLKNITDGLQKQIDELKAAQTGNPSDLENLRTALENLQNEVNGLRGLRADVDALRRLTDTFAKELQDLNVNVEQMKRDLADLADRVSRLEARRPTVDISGDANIWLGAGNSRGNEFGMNKDGFIVGQYNNPDGSATPAGITRDLTILHEAALTFTTTKETGPKFNGTIVVGNMLGTGNGSNFGPTGFVNQTYLPNQVPLPQVGVSNTYQEGNESVYVQNFGVKFDTSIAGFGFNAEVGRVGYKISPYIYQRLDNTSYFDNERWDNGKYYFDGGIVGFNLAGAKVDVFGGNNHNLQSTDGSAVLGTYANPYQGHFAPTGTFTADRSLGVNVNVPLLAAGNVNVAYLVLDSDSESQAVAGGPWISQGYNTPVAGGFVENNRLSIFGGTADYRFGRIKIEGGFSQSDLMENTHNVNSDDNRAYFGKIGYSGDTFGLYGQYRVVEAKYTAPGDWGRLGVERNPTNIKGFQVGGHLNLGNALVLKAEGEFDKGNQDGPAGLYAADSGFSTDTKIDKYMVGLDYKLSNHVNLMASYEDTIFRDLPGVRQGADGTSPRYRWATFGVGYGLSESTKLKIQYELSDINSEYFLSPVGAGGNFPNYHGGFLTTQLSVKF